MFRTTMFALTFAALSSTAAFADGDQPPRVGESHGSYGIAQVQDQVSVGEQTVRVGQAGKTVPGLPQVAEVTLSEARGAVSGR